MCAALGLLLGVHLGTVTEKALILSLLLLAKLPLGVSTAMTGLFMRMVSIRLRRRSWLRISSSGLRFLA